MFVHSGQGNPTSGTTYRLTALSTPSRVTILLAQFAGVAKKVWDLTYAEIRAIPLGAKATAEFRNEPAPTLDEAPAIARDRIGLNIELKFYGDHQPRLVERVLEALQTRQMTNKLWA